MCVWAGHSPRGLRRAPQERPSGVVRRAVGRSVCRPVPGQLPTPLPAGERGGARQPGGDSSSGIARSRARSSGAAGAGRGGKG